jgi:hypothetical protein
MLTQEEDSSYRVGTVFDYLPVSVTQRRAAGDVDLPRAGDLNNGLADKLRDYYISYMRTIPTLCVATSLLTIGVQGASFLLDPLNADDPGPVGITAASTMSAIEVQDTI